MGVLGVMEEKTYELYTLSCRCHPEAGIRYVGVTSCTVKVRLQQHLNFAGKGSEWPVSRWLRKHGRDNIIADVQDSAVGWKQAQYMERAWISIGRLGGWSLLNIVDGGEGIKEKFGRTREPLNDDQRKMFQDTRWKLQSSDIPDIKTRLRNGESASKIAKDYNCTPATITGIRVGRTWARINSEGIYDANLPRKAEPITQKVLHYEWDPEKSPRLTNEEVIAIRKLVYEGANFSQAAAKFGTNKSRVRKICRGLPYKSVPDEEGYLGQFAEPKTPLPSYADWKKVLLDEQSDEP